MTPRGFSLIETVVVLSIAALLLTLGVPRLLTISRKLRVEMAAHELMGVLRTARSAAIRLDANVGVKFRVERSGRVTYALYRDGDGDGVRTADIEAGVDPAESPLRELVHLGAHVHFGFPQGPAPRDPGDPRRRLRNLDDPIRFNRSDIASFNSLGGSTPGSLYVTDGLDHLAVVRLFGRTGKAKVLLYDRQREIWE
ncbi:MAG: prepilin-type N-terminal cleavage/methylation domain-containing protein [Thermoanaerobaculia bacterium]|nr:prepilin-type N-terminal cleavage/methylation domain-containing protein [Thermoanaerobaculia bacterium]